MRCRGSGEIEKVDHLLDGLAVRELLAPHARREQHLAEDVGLRAAVAADQQVVQHRGVLEQLDVLEGAGDAASRRWCGGDAGDVLALENEAAAGRLVDAADEVEDRGLAGAVGADDGEDLALLHVEGDPVDRADAAEVDREVLGLEERHRTRSVFM